MDSELLILYSNDTEYLKNALKQKFHRTLSINDVCVDHACFPLRPSCVQKISKAKLQVVFFSPEFFKFLECKPEEAFSICRLLNSEITYSIFCCGSTEFDVQCYHQAPLISYSNWVKFNMEDVKYPENVEFPELFIKKLEEFVSNKEDKYVEIVMVPEVITRGSSFIYLIFMEEANGKYTIVDLEGRITMQTRLEYVNPYVLKFKMPDILIESSSPIHVVLRVENRIIFEKELHTPYSSQTISTSTNSLKGSSSSSIRNTLIDKDELFLNEQLELLTDFAFLSPLSPIDDENKCLDDEFKVSMQDFREQDKDNETTQSLLQLCEKYGLEELTIPFLCSTCKSGETITTFINSPNSEEKVADAFETERVSSEEEKTFQERGTCTCPIEPYLSREISVSSSTTSSGLLKRSLSLPSTLLSCEEKEDSYLFDYLDMSATSQMKPHEKLLNEALFKDIDCDHYVSNTLSSHVYMSLVMPKKNEEVDNEILFKNCLSDSQQELLELMHAFKRGAKTISQVEQHFQEWHQKHRNTSSNRDYELRTLKNKYEKAQKVQSFGLPDWKSLILRKPKKKESKTSEENEKTKSKNRSDKKGSNARSMSKLSNASSSSGGSGSSEVFTISSWKYCNASPSEKVLPNSTSSHSSPFGVQHHPAFPERLPPPPPPPSRPPPTPEEYSRLLWAAKDSLAREKPVPLPRKFIGVLPPRTLELIDINKLNTENTNSNSSRPPSPDYITPNCPRQDRNQSRRKNANVPLNATILSPIPPERKFSAPDSSRNKTLSSECMEDQVNSNSKIAKSKKEQKPVIPAQISLFYVPRRCSSLPQLKVPKENNDYMELIGPSE